MRDPRSDKDTRHPLATPRHEHDYTDQPGGRCMCGQGRPLMEGVGKRRRAIEDELAAQLVRGVREKEDG